MRYEGTVYRPPGEWKSYLLQVTVGCSHNACTFCGMYKDKRYRVRPLEEIFEDIALARAAYGDVKRVFLCDGDAVAMDTGELLAVLARLYETFPPSSGSTPMLTRAAPCARRGRAGGPPPGGAGAPLPRGGERKRRGAAGGAQGVDAAGMLEAGRRITAAGFDLWAMVLIGLAGQGEASRAHALDTAALINAMRPRHLSALTYLPERGRRWVTRPRGGVPAADCLAGPGGNPAAAGAPGGGAPSLHQRPRLQLSAFKGRTARGQGPAAGPVGWGALWRAGH
ncbi:radical SAM protein [Flavonifractor plautii]|nr:radical SAM protein [Flavonifractor plautii]